MTNIIVPLERKFSLIEPTEDNSSDEGWLDTYLSGNALKIWNDLESEYRVVILADAGAGKTHETKNRASVALKQGRLAFFIRIEFIDANFENAFEVGDSEQFESWISSSKEAWFYLDSIDEARLDNPRVFEKALRCFARKIRQARHRAHIIITSRPYAWRFTSDKNLVDQLLPFNTPREEQRDSPEKQGFDTKGQEEKTKSALNIYRLKALDTENIRLFAKYHSVVDIDLLITELQRTNLFEMASRPFDLEGLLSKWKSDGRLGSRLESLQHIVDVRLNEITPDRKQRQPINQLKAREGACRLAAAVTLTGDVGILVPDSAHEKVGIDAEEVLADWEPNDVRALLERGIFNDIIYGAVRFRHRDIRELLTAEWLNTLLQKGGSRRQIESLLFRDQYGEQVIIPRLKPILPWLILFDESIRTCALALRPEIAVESGDASCLPLQTRKTILHNIVNRIVASEDDRSARDNSAIARIAQPDLADDVLDLIKKYSGNDDAIFFLGRLVWQGNMINCLDSLQTIAIDPNRNVYAKIASVRAVSTVGTYSQFKELWIALNNQPSILPRKVLAELLEEAKADDETVGLLLTSLDKLPLYERFEANNLDREFHLFLEKFASLSALDREQPLYKLCVGINSFLGRKPHFERGECYVSEEFSWLLGPASHAIKFLILDRSDVCFKSDIIDILLKMSAARSRRTNELNENHGRLKKMIPNWEDLNDELFWYSVDRKRLSPANKGKRVVDYWSVYWLDHYWQFGADSFPRIIKFIELRSFEDDKLVSLTLAFRVYIESEKNPQRKEALKQATVGNLVLENRLDELLNPVVSDDEKRRNQEYLEHEQQEKKERLEEEQHRSQCIKRLRENPDLVRNPTTISPGEWTNDQYWVFSELCQEIPITDRARGSNWLSLVDVFGVNVAMAFRDAAIKHWRSYQPELGSEGANTSSTPYLLVFALMGLEYESQELDTFPLNLTEIEVIHALRYLAWEINGFPSWLEGFHKVYPEAVLKSVWQELHWELQNIETDPPARYILSDIVTYAPWLHYDLSVHLQSWIEETKTSNCENLSYCLQILDAGKLSPDWSAKVAQTKISPEKSIEELSIWYALWVDTRPESGISAVEAWLNSYDLAGATVAAEQFIIRLLGGRRGSHGGTFVGNFKTALHLKSLYLLMHRYIKIEDDVDRAGEGVYSPGQRDDAQDARRQLFSLLTEIPGKETYIALIDLAKTHPVVNHRPWMVKQAIIRAEQDADLEPWDVKQVYEFSSLLEREPITHKQLFDLGTIHLNDFKDWLESGNDSLFETYQKANDEEELRKIVSHDINQRAKGRYTCAQENPLANNQRPDIWLQHHKVTSPVPIELKLLDKGWSGQKLCERLRNQLAGDYLREESAGCGVFLLIWQGSQPQRKWSIEGNSIGVSELQLALTNYWRSIANQFPNVSSIDVIVIDLTLRAEKSHT